jgi:hypothetical protein
MAWKCDVCGESIHIKRENNRNRILRCPLEQYKKVKSFYTPELRQLIASVLFDKDLPLSNSPEGLRAFQELIPDKSPLEDYVKSHDSCIYSKNLIIQATLSNFFNHFNRILIKIYDSNEIHFIEPLQEADKHEYNYFWLSPTHLRESYFKNGLEKAKLKSLTELGIPSLVLFPIGSVDSVKHSAFGDILLDLITHRSALGKPTWMINTKDLSQCPEVKSSEGLRKYLSSPERTYLKLDPDGLLDTPTTESPPTNGNKQSTSSYL